MVRKLAWIATSAFYLAAHAALLAWALGTW